MLCRLDGSTDTFTLSIDLNPQLRTHICLSLPLVAIRPLGAPGPTGLSSDHRGLVNRHDVTKAWESIVAKKDHRTCEAGWRSSRVSHAGRCGGIHTDVVWDASQDPCWNSNMDGVTATTTYVSNTSPTPYIHEFSWPRPSRIAHRDCLLVRLVLLPRPGDRGWRLH